MGVKRKGSIAALAVAAIAVGSSFQTPRSEREGSQQQPTSAPRLVSVQEVTDMCQPADLIAGLDTLFAPLQAATLHAAQTNGETTVVSRQPLRQIRDTDPMYSALALDLKHDEVVMMDPNYWAFRVFNRLDNTPPNAARTEPKRVIVGPQSNVQYVSHVYVDPENGDLYGVENDTGDSIQVWAHGADGNVTPKRKLNIVHYGYALAADEEKDELFMTVHLPPQVVVYRKQAEGDEQPLRILRGPRTQMADTHGLAIDVKRQLMFTNNWGAYSNFKVLGGSFSDASITVFPLNASGDTPPLRVIKGPKTLLNWPANMSIDPNTGDLYVANSVDQSILVFSGTAEGDVAPKRIIKGDRTGISYPLSVVADVQNNELWVSNFGNASASVYPLTANGNVAPIRTIRSAPQGKQSLGNGGKAVAITYDPKREEVLVHN